MNNTSVIQSLRQEASSNKISADIFLCLGLRERARNDVTVTGLAARMKEDGFDYPEAEYARFIRFLANLQLGTLKTDSKGRAVAIQDIRLTLQSIGQAALGERHSFLAWKQRKRYIKLLGSSPSPRCSKLRSLSRSPLGVSRCRSLCLRDSPLAKSQSF
jgi:hypothetical protein